MPAYQETTNDPKNFRILAVLAVLVIAVIIIFVFQSSRDGAVPQPQEQPPEEGFTKEEIIRRSAPPGSKPKYTNDDQEVPAEFFVPDDAQPKYDQEFLDKFSAPEDSEPKYIK